MRTNKIPKEHVVNVCKLGCGEEVCAYLALTSDGWTCLKTTSMRGLVDQRLRNGEMTAKGDNCEGVSDEEPPPDSGKTWN